jgi:hypothetical protein
MGLFDLKSCYRLARRSDDVETLQEDALRVAKRSFRGGCSGAKRVGGDAGFGRGGAALSQVDVAHFWMYDHSNR